MVIRHRYTPFLKFKTNEVAGLSTLDLKLKRNLVPFFDLPRKKGMTRDDFEKVVNACYKKAEKYLVDFPYIFVDSFDIPDSIAVSNFPNCSVIIDKFKSFEYVPVLGLDRASDHNKAIFDAKTNGDIVSDRIAVRFQPDEFSSFDLIRDELLELFQTGENVFLNWIFIFDCRVCPTGSQKGLANAISDFVSNSSKIIDVDEYIVTGSSIPASIRDIANPSGESVINRLELEVFHFAQSMVSEIPLSLGDYTIVSPLYSEITIEPELMLSITAPKVFYAYKNFHYIARGERIKTGGYSQYDEICENIVSKSFYRSAHYSWGDNFIKERADGFRERFITPSTILKPTICAHIEYMAKDYPN